MTSIPKLVVDESNKENIPAWVLGDIIAVESDFNPSLVGDNGTSFGLLQEHYGGQADGHTQAELLNPQSNLDIGTPPIAKAYRDGVAGGITDRVQLLQYVANNSGHPDNLGVAWTQANEPSYDQKLSDVVTGKRVYTDNTIATLIGSGSPNGAFPTAPVQKYHGLAGVFEWVDNAENPSTSVLSGTVNWLSGGGVTIVHRLPITLLGLGLITLVLAGIIFKKAEPLLPLVAAAM